MIRILDAKDSDTEFRKAALWDNHFPNFMRWGPGHIGLGLSYVYGQIRQSEADNWAGTEQHAWRGAPQFKFVINGAKFVDPRVPVAQAAGRTFTPPLNSSPRWTDNCALIRAQILLQFREISPKNIDLDALAASTNLCNEYIIFHDWPDRVPSDTATPSLASHEARSSQPGTFAIWQQKRGPRSTGQLRRLYKAVDQTGPTEMAAFHPTRSNIGRVPLDGDDPEDRRDAYNVITRGVSEVIHKDDIRGGGEYFVYDPNSGYIPLWFISPWYWTDTNANQVGPGQARIYFENGKEVIYFCTRTLPAGYWTAAVRRRPPSAADGWVRAWGQNSFHKRLPQGLTDAERARWPGSMLRYTAHGEVVSGQSLQDVEKQIDDAMNGITTEFGGKYYIRAARGESLDGTVPTPVATIEDVHLLENGLSAYQTRPPEEQIYTTINVSLLQDAQLGHRASQFTAVDTSREADIGGRVKGRSVNFNVVTNTAQARALANSALLQNRHRQSFTARITPRIGSATGETPFTSIRPGDLVRCQLSYLRWRADLNQDYFLFHVERRVLHPNMELELDLVSWSPSTTFYGSPETVPLVRITAPRPRPTQVTSTAPVGLRFATNSARVNWNTLYLVSYALPRTIGSQSGVFYTVTGIPDGLSWDKTSHTLKGHPTTAGMGTVLVTARKGVSSASASVQWTVIFTPVPSFDATVINFDWNISDPVQFPLPRLSNEPSDTVYRVFNLPGGVQYDSARHFLHGTPTDEGTGSGTMEATHGTHTDTVSLFWTITEEIAPPFLFAVSSMDFNWDIAAVVSRVLPRILQEPMGTTYAATGLPDGITYNPATYSLTGTPAEVTAGTSGTGTLTATQGTNEATISLVWQIAEALPEPPFEFPSQEIEFRWDTSESIDYELPRVAGDQAGIIYGVENLPSGVEYNYDTHKLEGTPDARGDGVSEFLAVRGTDEATMTLAWSILRMGSPLPFAFTAEGRTFSWNTDETIDYILPRIPGTQTGIVYTVTGLPAGVTFTPATRTLSGTPEASAAGTGTAVYTATHGTDTDSIDLSWTVVDTTTPPLKFDVETLTFNWETTTQVSFNLPRVIGSQTDVGYTLTGLPAGVRYNPSQHRIEGLPTEDGTGMTFLSAARGGVGAEVIITWTITTPVILQFPTMGDTVEWDILTDVTYILPRTVTEPSGLTYGIAGLPSGIVWNETTHSISGRPAISTVGTSGTVILSAAHGTDTTTFNIAWTIQGIEFGQTQVNMGRDVGEDHPFVLPRVLENVAGITYAMTDLPAGMTYDSTAHTIAGAPTTASTGIATLTATLHASTATLAVHWVVEELALALSEFDQSGLDVDCAALITAGGTTDWYATGNRGSAGTLDDGEIGIGDDNDPITRLRVRSASQITINNDGPPLMREYFGDRFTRSEWTFYIQTRTGLAFTDQLGTVGGGYVNVEFKEPLHQEILGTIRAGTPFIFAVAKTSVLLQLTDFDETDLNVDAKALITASDDVDWYVAPSRFGNDSVTDGELGLGVGQTVIDRIKRFSADSSIVILNDSDAPVALNLRDYFGVEAGLQRDAGWTLYIQTKQGVASTNTVFNSGGGYVNMQFEDNVEILDSISNGTRFIAAIARPVVFEFATETFPVTGNIFEAVAFALPRIPDEPVGTTYTLSNPPSGLTFSAADHNLTGTFDPALTGTSGTSVLTATQGTRTATVNIEWSVALIQGFVPAFVDYHWNTSTAVDITLEGIADQTGSATITYTASDLPAGLSFDAATRRVTGTPTASGDGTAFLTAWIGTSEIGSLFIRWDVTTEIQYQVYATRWVGGTVTMESVDLDNPANSTAVPGSLASPATFGSVEIDGELHGVAANKLWRIDRTNLSNSVELARVNGPLTIFSAFVWNRIIYQMSLSRYYTIDPSAIENNVVRAVDSGVNPSGSYIYGATEHLGEFYWIDSRRSLYRAPSLDRIDEAIRVGSLPRRPRNSEAGMASANGMLYILIGRTLYRMTDAHDISTLEEVGNLPQASGYYALGSVKSLPSAADAIFEIEELNYEWDTTFAVDIPMPRIVGPQTGVTYYARNLPDGITYDVDTNSLTGTATTSGSGTANFYAQKGSQTTNITINYDVALLLSFADNAVTFFTVNTRTDLRTITLPRAGPRDPSSASGIGPEPSGIMYTAEDLPTGVTFNQAQHRLEGSIPPDFAEDIASIRFIATAGGAREERALFFEVQPLDYEA